MADLAGDPPEDLIAAMRLAQNRDMVARQYASNFQDVFETVVPCLMAALETLPLSAAIVHLHLELLSRFPDSLIARRRGIDVARRAGDMAATVLAAGRPGDEAYLRGLADLDFWLRSDGHARNPGTTADLVAAGLFVALREGMIPAPFRLADFGCRELESVGKAATQENALDG
jgi:triphosphoribosyl-dephospho-CoA synthase